MPPITDAVAPRDVVAACLPDPAHLGDRMTGKTCAGTWVKGTKDGQPREVYLYQVADDATTMRDYGVQAVVWQTAVGPVTSPWSCWLKACEKALACLGPKRSTPTPSWRGWTPMALPVRSGISPRREELTPQKSSDRWTPPVRARCLQAPRAASSISEGRPPLSPRRSSIPE
jgi:hypothetical protein